MVCEPLESKLYLEMAWYVFSHGMECGAGLMGTFMNNPPRFISKTEEFHPA
jgi:hypothetical protein